MTIQDAQAIRLEDLDPAHVVDLDLGDDSIIKTKEILRLMREWAQKEPFYCTRSGVPIVVCGRYEDVKAVYSDTDDYSMVAPDLPGYYIFDFFAGLQAVAQMDGEDHLRVRRLMAPAFMPAGVNALKEATQKIVDEKLDAIEAKGDRFDVMADFAGDIITRVLLDAAFSLTEEQQRAFERAHEGFATMVDLGPDDEYPTEFMALMINHREMMMGVIEDRRRNPTNDVLGKLISATYEEDRLSNEELFGQINALCGAALGTTTSSFGNAMLVLGRNPDQLELLKSDMSLLDSAVSECLRYQSTGYFAFPRYAKKDTVLNGVKIPKDIPVLASSQGAHFDPTMFPDPDRFDIRRNPQGILTFGIGPHHCVGNRLGRMVIQTSLESMLKRFPKLRLEDPAFEPEYKANFFGELTPKTVPMLIN
ncbi:cytochrome P450 [Actibacterium sp. D379-3]